MKLIGAIFAGELMNGRIASVLIVVALMTGAGIGMFVEAVGSHTVTETQVSTVYQRGGQQLCLVTTYRVFSVESIQNGTTIGGTSTQASIASSFTTEGYPSSTTITPTTTQTGSRAWNVTNCFLMP